MQNISGFWTLFTTKRRTRKTFSISTVKSQNMREWRNLIFFIEFLIKSYAAYSWSRAHNINYKQNESYRNTTGKTSQCHCIYKSFMHNASWNTTFISCLEGNKYYFVESGSPIYGLRQREVINTWTGSKIITSLFCG